ncbi:MAG: rod shape-determining protein MreC [bacterium]|nr:rod shape-determining protein MreC [bacterium]
MEKTLSLRSIALGMMAACLLLVLDSFALLEPFKDAARMATPFQMGLVSMGSSFARIPQTFQGLWMSARDVETLRRRVIDLESENASLRNIEEEYDGVYRQLSGRLREKNRLLPSHVIRRGQNIRLDVGSRDGVTVGAPVVLDEILVGIVVGVSSRTSDVMLVTDPKSTIEVVVGQKTGLVVGTFGLMELTRVLQGVPLAEGMMLTTKGDEFLPPGLSVGKVTHIEKQEAEVFQRASVVPLFEAERLKTTFVVMQK